MMVTKIGVLGCGWLGLPLAKRLVTEGYRVKGSVTGEMKISKLAAGGITPFLIDLSAPDVFELQVFLEELDVLIVTVPPKFTSADFDVISGFRWLVHHIELQRVSRVVYVSSISVYEDRPDFPVYLEEEASVATSGKSEKLIQLENLFLKSTKFRTGVLRLGGLLGEDRHPIRYLSGRTNVPNPAAPVNLVHQRDCIEVILSLLEQDWFGGVLNVVSPEHPSKQDYYNSAAGKARLPRPRFSPLQSVGKKVSSEKLQRELGYKFQVEL